jgi:hypothetical protein
MTSLTTIFFIVTVVATSNSKQIHFTEEGNRQNVELINFPKRKVMQSLEAPGDRGSQI